MTYARSKEGSDFLSWAHVRQTTTPAVNRIPSTASNVYYVGRHNKVQTITRAVRVNWSHC